jgi:ComF family protein
MPEAGPAGWVRGLRDVVFPPLCVQCRGLVEREAATPTGETHPYRHVCVRCAPLLEPVRPPHCATCGHPFFGEVGEARRCVKCDGLEPAYGEGRTAVLFKGPARALVIELKYHRGLHVLEDIAEIFRRSPHVLELARGATIVPVPLHARKLRERGYNQAKLLAETLAAVAGDGAAVQELLVRDVDTQTQTAFDRRTRMGNLKNAFALARGADLNPAPHYLLVDDVFTTGSTLNSCARTLRRAGALKLDVVTFGHG